MVEKNYMVFLQTSGKCYNYLRAEISWASVKKGLESFERYSTALLRSDDTIASRKKN
jgi:hypothetical protein